jgi:hypothetical protein
LFFVYFLVQANIICPLYRKGTRAADVEKYIIYNVSREEFENCQGPILQNSISAENFSD